MKFSSGIWFPKSLKFLKIISIFHQSHPYGLPPKDVWSYRGKTKRLSANARTYLYGSLHEHVERDGNVHKIGQIPKYPKPTTDKPKNKSFSFFCVLANKCYICSNFVRESKIKPGHRLWIVKPRNDHDAYGKGKHYITQDSCVSQTAHPNSLYSKHKL